MAQVILNLSGQDINLAGPRREPTLGFYTTTPGSVAPGTGINWKVGDRIFASNPISGGASGWVCTVKGNPGTWVALPEIVAA